MKSIEWNGRELILLDQTKLPTEISYLHCTDRREVADAIYRLEVRGAPAIGVAAAYAVVLAAREIAGDASQSRECFSAVLRHAADELIATRPTAVNLAWAVNRMVKAADAYMADMAAGDGRDVDTVTHVLYRLEAEAVAIHEEDLTLNAAMAIRGAELLKETVLQKVKEGGRDELRILTHCNAGALATAGIGTALGIVRKLHEEGLVERVYADETRPLLQGARLTALELKEDGIPVTVLTDSMAAYAMKCGLVDAVIVGADRITKNGDVANKIGTYGVALAAKAHGIPFYVAAPYGTFDPDTECGEDITIEMRPPEEVTGIGKGRTVPEGIDIFNPAFDVTPHALITAIISERGVHAFDTKEE